MATSKTNETNLEEEFHRLFDVYRAAQNNTVQDQSKVHEAYSSIMKFVDLHPEFMERIIVSYKPSISSSS